jgi:hypothetical protein
VTEHWDFVIARMVPVVRPAQRSTVDLGTVFPTLAVPLTAVITEVGAEGELCPIEFEAVTVKV